MREGWIEAARTQETTRSRSPSRWTGLQKRRNACVAWPNPFTQAAEDGQEKRPRSLTIRQGPALLALPDSAMVAGERVIVSSQYMEMLNILDGIVR